MLRSKAGVCIERVSAELHKGDGQWWLQNALALAALRIGGNPSPCGAQRGPSSLAATILGGLDDMRSMGKDWSSCYIEKEREVIE